ncbi:MAG: hypothetical protein IIY93_08805 [Clostridia bacterium]|nr:hypothetical protein [Clostridia bacterium]
MMKKAMYSIIATITTAFLLLSMLGGCDNQKTDTGTGEFAGSFETGRQDGERFEDVIMIEGMEETVKYEHIRNDSVGIEMDYDYERFERHSESDRECFISIYDDPQNPQIYLEVTTSADDADTVAATIGETLSANYDIIKESITLDRAGDCILIDASNAKGNKGTPDLLQTVYIIPAADGCRIATAHYTFESAEGFGRRFNYIMNTFVVIDRRSVSSGEN